MADTYPDENLEIVIRPDASSGQYWRDIWTYRELFFFLVWRDVIVRYKQAVIGILWCILKPFLTMVVFTVIFGRLAGLPSDGVPYPILVFSALLPWQFFAGSLQDSSNSVIANSNLLTKVYFPRFVIPLSAVMANIVDLLISLLVFIGIMFWFQFVPGGRVLLLPMFFLPAICASLGAGLWFAALNVKYRDFKLIVPFIAQFGLFISPVGFSSSIIPAKWKMLYSLNPMVAVIDGFRWSIAGETVPLYLQGLVLSYGASIALLVTGIWYFRKTERTFADVI